MQTESFEKRIHKIFFQLVYDLILSEFFHEIITDLLIRSQLIEKKLNGVIAFFRSGGHSEVAPTLIAFYLLLLGFSAEIKRF